MLMKDLFINHIRVQFLEVADDGAAIFYSASQCMMPDGISPKDGHCTFRANEETCKVRLQNCLANAVLKERNPKAYEHDVATNRLALESVQNWKKERGITLTTTDLVEPKRDCETGLGLSLQ